MARDTNTGFQPRADSVKRSPLKRKTSLRRKRSKPRSVRAACTVRGCSRPPKAASMCLTHCKRECDRLFSLRVRACGRCEHCKAQSGLQCAHLISRRYAAIRFDRTNAVALCARCHTYFTHRPLEWEVWCYARLGKGFDLLKSRALGVTKPDYDAILRDLRATT